jgi:hypothetical protein
MWEECWVCFLVSVFSRSLKSFTCLWCNRWSTPSVSDQTKSTESKW